MKNKLLKIIEENNNRFDKTERGEIIMKIIGCQKHGANKDKYIELWDDLHNDDIYFIKEYYNQSRIKELEVIIERAKKVPTGLFDSTIYMKKFIDEFKNIIKELKN